MILADNPIFEGDYETIIIICINICLISILAVQVFQVLIFGRIQQAYQ